MQRHIREGIPNIVTERILDILNIITEHNELKYLPCGMYNMWAHIIAVVIGDVIEDVLRDGCQDYAMSYCEGNYEGMIMGMLDDHDYLIELIRYMEATDADVAEFKPTDFRDIFDDLDKVDEVDKVDELLMLLSTYIANLLPSGDIIYKLSCLVAEHLPKRCLNIYSGLAMAECSDDFTSYLVTISEGDYYAGLDSYSGLNADDVDL